MTLATQQTNAVQQLRVESSIHHDQIADVDCTNINTPTAGTGDGGEGNMTYAAASSEYTQADTLATDDEYHFLASDFTIACRMASLTTSDDYLYGFGSSSNSTPIAYIRTNSGGKARAFVRAENSQSVTITGTTSVDDGNEHVICITRTGEDIRLYVDGSLEAGPTAPGASFGTFDDVDQAAVGALWRSSPSSYYDGEATWCVAYSVALSASEVAELDDSVWPFPAGSSDAVGSGLLHSHKLKRRGLVA